MRTTGPALVFLALATPAHGCLPPPPGSAEAPPPPAAERARQIHGWATDIVYGVTRSEPDAGGRYRFRIIHVYKGALRPGQTIVASGSFGFDVAPCLGASPPPPLERGRYGVVAFRNDRPELNFLDDRLLSEMFAAGLIVRASPAAAR